MAAANAGAGPPLGAPLANAIPHYYDELRELAARFVAAESNGLNATSLVHEAFLRWTRSPSLKHMGRGELFSIAATEFRRILVERARKRTRREKLLLAMPVTPEETPFGPDRVDILALDEILSELGARGDGRVVRVVELRFLVGLTVEATAAVLGVSPATVKLDWAYGKAYLRDHLERGPGDGHAR